MTSSSPTPRTGRPHAPAARTERDLVRAATWLRRFLQEPSRLWQIRDDPVRAVLQAARSIDRDAAAYFGEPAILACAATASALTAAGHSCRWCPVYARVGQGGPVPPVNAATIRLLGDSCQRCSKINLRRVLRALDEEMAAHDPAVSPGGR